MRTRIVTSRPNYLTGRNRYLFSLKMYATKLIFYEVASHKGKKHFFVVSLNCSEIQKFLYCSKNGQHCADLRGLNPDTRNWKGYLIFHCQQKMPPFSLFSSIFSAYEENNEVSKSSFFFVLI